jgi:hypothetical protein
MVGLAILIATLVITMGVVRIGGLALELTGMPREMARFQALSAFTGTGFTTRAAEDVVRHPQRRSIITVLIVMGWAGMASIITGMIQAFRAETLTMDMGLRMVVAAVCIVVLYRVLLLPRLSASIDRVIRAQLERHTGLEPLELEEILRQAEGWGIARLEVPEQSPLAGKALEDSRPRDMGILVIAIERGDELIPSPGGRDTIYVGDRLVAYGPLRTMRAMASGASARPGPAVEG